MIKNSLITLCLIGLFAFGANAQNTSCTQNLNSAEDLFEEGNLLDIPRLLNSCFRKSGFSREETIRAYRLLTLVYIYTDNEALAEQSLINLFKADPEHPLDPNDPAELALLYDKFKSKPIFRVGIKAGLNWTNVNSIQTFGSFNTASTLTAVQKAYSAKVGVSLEATFEYQLTDNLEAIAGLNYSAQSYEVVNSPYAEEIFNVTLTESQTWLKIPIMARYGIQLGSIKPYVFGGISVDYLLAASMSGRRQGGQSATIDGQDLIDDKLRSQLHQSIIGGVGLKLKSKTNFVVIEARYSQGLRNIVETSNRLVNQELVFRAGHVDDNFSINNMSISIGYIKSLYKPKKYSAKKLAKRAKKKETSKQK